MFSLPKINNKGAIPLLILISVIGLIIFLAISATLPIKDQLLNSIFPKPPSYAAGELLTVDVSKPIRPFSKQMLGEALVNWEHSWGRPFPNEVPGLAQAMKGAGVGVIRYAGGLWANSVGWDRTTQKTPFTAWTKNGNTYYFHYGTDEMDSLNKLADAVGSEVMIQVNIASNDPAMWADMVRYVNIEKGYNFKYWELGNEFDHDVDKNVSPDEYVTRMKLYIDAMKAVDPSIKIIVGVPASAHDAPRLGWSDAVTALSEYLTKSAPAVSSGGRKPDDLSYHWYQSCNSGSVNDVLLWKYDGLATNSWRNSYSRIWSQIVPTRVKNEAIGSNLTMRQGITELEFDACNYDNQTNGNHINALWGSDVIGRLAYNGLDFAAWYEGYGGQGLSLIYPDSSDFPTKLFVRPSYYAPFMYNKYFGDQLVQSASYDDSKISIYASTDTKDAQKLKLRITNLTGSPITTPINLTGFAASTGSVYVLQSNNPLDVSATSNTQSASTNINGVKLDGSNIVSSASLIQPVPLVVNGSSFNFTFPAYSSTAIILQQGTASAAPSVTPSIAPSPSLSPSPSVVVSPSPGKTGDLNGDGKINITDLSILLSKWNTNDIVADLNKDGKVNVTDLSILLSFWGK